MTNQNLGRLYGGTHCLYFALGSPGSGILRTVAFLAFRLLADASNLLVIRNLDEFRGVPVFLPEIGEKIDLQFFENLILINEKTENLISMRNTMQKKFEKIGKNEKTKF